MCDDSPLQDKEGILVFIGETIFDIDSAVQVSRDERIGNFIRIDDD
jgi:hypothetical protein